MFGEWFFGSDPEFNQQCKNKSREFAGFKKKVKRRRPSLGARPKQALNGSGSVALFRPVLCLLFTKQQCPRRCSRLSTTFPCLLSLVLARIDEVSFESTTRARIL